MPIDIDRIYQLIRDRERICSVTVLTADVFEITRLYAAQRIINGNMKSLDVPCHAASDILGHYVGD